MSDNLESGGDEAPLIEQQFPSKLMKASLGDPNAAREILERMLVLAHADPSCSADAMACAEFIARMLATTGRMSDEVALAGVLLKRASEVACQENSERLLGEAFHMLLALSEAGNSNAQVSLIGLLSSMAERGDEEASVLLNEWVGRVPARVADEARGQMRDLSKAMAGENQ